MKKNIVLVVLSLVFVKLFGIGRELVLAYFYGATAYSDVYLISSSIPTTVLGLVTAGLTTSFIPVYNKVKNEYSEEEAQNYTSNLLNILFVLSLILSFISSIFVENIVKIFASGFTGETLELAVQFTRYTIWAMVFTALISIMTGFLQIRQRFIIPIFLGLLMNIVVIVSIVLGAHFEYPIIMAIGVIVSGALQFLVLYISQKMLGYRHKALFKPTDKHIKYMLYISVPVIIGTSVDQLNAIIDKSIASSVAVGGISILNYASKISDSILNLFVTSIATVLFPSLSEAASSGDLPRVRKLFGESIRYVSIITIPTVIGIIIYAQDIVTIFYGRGQFTQSALELTTFALIYYTFGSYAFGLRQIATRMFYALHDTKTPVYSSVIAVILNIILNLILSRYMGIPGLALATSISAYVSILLLFYFASRKIGNLEFKATLFVIIKITFSGILMAICSLSFYREVQNYLPKLTSLIFSVIVAVIVYIIVMLFMKIEEVNEVKAKVINKIKK